MNLFINAVNLSSAGGLNVALNFLKGLVQLKHDDWVVHIAAPRGCGYETLTGKNVVIHYVSNWSVYWVARVYVDYWWVPALIRQTNPDVVFTMGNFATPTRKPQAVLLHYPHPAYPEEKEVWKRLDFLGLANVLLRNYIFKHRIHYINLLLVQTETICKRVKDLYPNLPAIKLFPNAYTQLSNQTLYQLPFIKEVGVRYLICLSRYYPHKNIEILIDVARLIREQGLSYRLLITIDPEHHRKSTYLLKCIKNEGLENILINIGTVPSSAIASLHEQVDALILPTLLESFSATYVDAMHFGLPIFTSNRDFSREICEDCAYYFDPLSADDILRVVDDGFNNQSQLAKKIEQGLLRSSKMPSWTDVTQIGIDAIYSLSYYESTNTNS